MTATVIPLPLPAPAVARVAGVLRNRYYDAVHDREISQDAFLEAFRWLEGWVCEQSARLGVEIVT